MDNGFVNIPHPPLSEALMNDPFVLVGCSAPSSTMENMGQSTLCMDGLNPAMVSCSHVNGNTQIMNDIAARDDGSRLVLGLGPTPNFYSAASTGSKQEQRLSGQSSTFTDSGMLRLGLQMDGGEAIQYLQAPNGALHSLGVVDEASTSATVRNMGGYMPSLLFAPRANSTVNETQVETPDSLDLTHSTSNSQHVQHHLQLRDRKSVV